MRRLTPAASAVLALVAVVLVHRWPVLTVVAFLVMCALALAASWRGGHHDRAWRKHQRVEASLADIEVDPDDRMSQEFDDALVEELAANGVEDVDPSAFAVLSCSIQGAFRRVLGVTA